MTALQVFESAARLRSFRRTADEFNLAQSSVSRHIADLERSLPVRLFEREHRGVRLTEAGERLHRAVLAGLERIETGLEEVVGDRPGNGELVIACGQATSHLFVMPRFEALRETLDEGVSIRILSCDYEMLDRLGASDADLVLSFETAGRAPEDRPESRPENRFEDRRTAFRQNAITVCSPDFAAAHADTLRRPVGEWGALPFLDYPRPFRGWVTWGDWFESFGRPEPPPEYIDYEDYTYMIDAAISGRGLALVWDAFVGHFLAAGTLVTAAAGFVEFDCPLYVRITERGRSNPAARQGYNFFASRSKTRP